MNEGPEDTAGRQDRPTIPSELVVGSVWRHANGELYYVDTIRNLFSTDQDEYPTTVCYIRMADGTEWCKPVSGFLNKRTFVKTSVAWSQVIGPYSRWRNNLSGEVIQVLGVFNLFYPEANGGKWLSVQSVIWIENGECHWLECSRFSHEFSKCDPLPRTRTPQS